MKLASVMNNCLRSHRFTEESCCDGHLIKFIQAGAASCLAQAYRICYCIQPDQSAVLSRHVCNHAIKKHPVKSRVVILYPARHERVSAKQHHNTCEGLRNTVRLTSPASGDRGQEFVMLPQRRATCLAKRTRLESWRT